MGGLLAEPTGSDFKTGAAAAGLNEALINGMAAIRSSHSQLQAVQNSSLKNIVNTKRYH
jgi:filamentous hemagglutinin